MDNPGGTITVKDSLGSENCSTVRDGGFLISGSSSTDLADLEAIASFAVLG